MSIFSTLNGIIGGGVKSNWFIGADGQPGVFSVDNGASWSDITGNTDRSPFYGLPSNVVMGSGFSSFGVYRSTDGGDNFSFISNPTSGNSIQSFSGDNSNDWVCTASGSKLAHSGDNGLSWSAVTNPVSFSFAGVTNDGNGNYVAVGVNTPLNLSVITSSDSGVSWTDRSFVRTSSTNDQFFDISTDGTTWIAVGARGTIYKSTNAGVSWTEITTSPFGSTTGDTIGSVCNFNGVWIIGGLDSSLTSGKLAISRSTDSGATWSSFISNPGTNANGFLRVRVGGDGLFMGTYFQSPSHNSFTSIDNGLTWINEINTGLTGSQTNTTTHFGNTSGNT